MKWDDSQIDTATGKRIRTVVFQTHEYRLELTDYNGEQMVLKDDITLETLAWAMRHGRNRWGVQITGALGIDIGGKKGTRKHVHYSCGTKEKAIELMLDYEELRKNAKHVVWEESE